MKVVFWMLAASAFYAQVISEWAGTLWEVGVMFQISEATAHGAFGSIWRLGCADGWKDGSPCVFGKV